GGRDAGRRALRRQDRGGAVPRRSARQSGCAAGAAGGAQLPALPAPGAAGEERRRQCGTAAYSLRPGTGIPDRGLAQMKPPFARTIGSESDGVEAERRPRVFAPDVAPVPETIEVLSDDAVIADAEVATPPRLLGRLGRIVWIAG